MQTTILPYQRVIKKLCQVAVNLKIPEQVRWKALNAILKVIGKAFGIVFEYFQKCRIWRFISDLPQFFEVSCRGGSKTQDFIIASFILCQGEYTQCYWLAGNNKQLEEAIKKSKPLLLLFGATEGTSSRSHDPTVEFDNGSQIEFNPMTATSGGRKNLVVLDEGGKVEDKDKKDNYRFALGLKEGTFIDLSEDAVISRLQGQIVASNSGAKRIRHCSTLAYNTPAEEFYKILEPMGLVFITTVDQVWWVRDSYQNDPVVRAMPDWWVKMEYWCILMPKGQKIFPQNPVIIKGFNVHAEMARDKDAKVLLGADHNPAWGHAFVAVFQHAGGYIVFDELRTLPPAPAIAFLKKYIDLFPGRVYLKFEKPTVINIVDDIKAAGITIHEFESWDAKTQTLKVTIYQGLVEHGRISYTGNCTMIVGQHEKYALDEAGKIAKQEDHMLDATSHVIESELAHFSISAPCGHYDAI